MAVEFSAEAGEGERTRHIGYWLIGEGRPKLEQAARMKPSLRQRLGRIGRAAPLFWFIGGVLVVTFLLWAAILGWSYFRGDVLHPQMTLPTALLIALPLLIVASQVGVDLVNWITTRLTHPWRLPRLDFEEGIPADAPTVVAVPTMLSDKEGVDALVEGLEVRFLANRDEHLRFAILSDFPDADEETTEADQELVDYAVARVERLNREYGFDDFSKFMLLHRPRKWNAAEGAWMGWERKRGKLMEFNRLLRPCDAKEREKALATFDRYVGRPELLEQIRYVITLDSDTELPRESARELVGSAHHLLNRPVWDEAKDRVTSGYGILQPRVDIDLPSAGQSIYSRLMSGEPGIDPYTLTVSDVYQDAFGEGSFIGKGIYHADIFEKACGSRFPENTVLSHDLIESAFARSALVTDVVLYEDYPSSYMTDAARRHRWTRGDWQIAPFVLPWVKTPEGKWKENRLSGLARWKIFDNLRRSLVAPAVLLTLLIAWIGHPTAAWAWTLLVMGFYLLPPVLNAVLALAGKNEELPWRMHVSTVRGQLVQSLGRSALAFLLLPYEAYKSIDAIARTLYRMNVSRRHLLEWTTAADAERKARRDHQSFWEAMTASPIIAASLFGYMLAIEWEQTFAVLPVLIGWFLSPSVAWIVSRPLPKRRLNVSTRDRRFLRKLARRTWTFFEQFVGPADNYLPPDNYQEEPREAVAHRTSPTNIGLALVANLGAWDFGYATLGQLLDRTERTFSALESLELHRGHLLNWYDTQTLQPLQPRYVSSVDSGNFVASVQVLKLGLRGLIDAPPISNSCWRGMEDSIRLLLDTVRGRERVAMPGGEVISRKIKLSSDLLSRLDSLLNECEQGGPTKLSGAKLLLQRLSIAASEAVAAVGSTGHAEAIRWANEFNLHADRFAEELHHLCPWVDLVGPARPYHGTDAASKRRLAVLEQTLERLETYPTLRDIAALHEEVLPVVDAIVEEVEAATLRPHVDLEYFLRVRRILSDAADRAASRIASLEHLIARCEPFLEADFGFVYDHGRNLLHIGYNVTDRRLDAGYYDLLASEMRLGSFFLVGKGAVPQEHWFRLGRQITTSGSHSALLSWSGSMFEYLMPLLLMPTYEDTLLDQTYYGVVNRQMEYAKQRGNVPWGISESGYNATDAQLNYQYRPFGVPGLGYKRGLGEDLVIAPYASVMATMIDPAASAGNLRRMRQEGWMGRFGFFEAIDFTQSRIKRGEREAVVRSFMAHHQAMAFLSLAYLLLDHPMQKRLMSDPAFKSAELLLHEKVPKSAPVYPHAGEHAGSKRITDLQAAGTVRVFRSPHTTTPEVHLLSNGRFSVMVTAAGSGYTRWDGLAVTRWHEDATRDPWGTFVYLRDEETGEFWSNTYQPTLRKPDRYEAIFSQARAEFRRVDRLGDPGRGEAEIDCHTQISVSPEDDMEVRRLTLTNNGRTARTIELTSYAEAVLAEPQADAAHPAFQNLFVQTRLVRGRQAILAKRRPRKQGERSPYLIHLMVLHGRDVEEAQYETDRGAFIGRGRTLSDPIAMHRDKLGDSAGSVLDPIVSVRRKMRLEPGESFKVDVVTGMAESNEHAHALIERYHDRRLNDRVAELAWTQSQVVLRQLNATEENAQLFGRLASSVIYATAQRRATGEVIARNQEFNRKQSNLWAYGISGDDPIVLVRIKDLSKISLVREAVQAHAYWRRKGLKCDLVIWHEENSGYRAEMHDAIMNAISAAGEGHWLDKSGGIFVRRIEQFAEEDRTLIQALARVILTDSAGTLAEQVDLRVAPESMVPRLVPSQPTRGRREIETAAEFRERQLIFRNGIGGFTADGKEYVCVTTPEQPTPAPWCNVLANPQFGTVISESGAGYTWDINAREYRLTPWYNDPVSDTSGEAFYLRDEESGHYWSPTPLPTRGTMPYVTRHGFGYSVFEYQQEGLETETTVFVHKSEPVKFWKIRLRNTTDRRRKTSLYGYVEWTLADRRPSGAMHVVTQMNPRTQAIFARNPYNAEFGGKVAFFNTSEPQRTLSGDRTEFLGRNGSPVAPAALERQKLSGKVGAGLDPCAALRVAIDLAPGEEKIIVFTLGAGSDEAHAQHLAERFASSAATRDALQEVWEFWGRTLGTLFLETPDASANVLANGWLEYQVLACRYWGRSGFYQSGGAYGFRDQLQDVAALLFSAPHLIREHLLRAAAHQFKEGDVLHWWHPPSGRGVRTHFSDDYMWLPLIAARYIKATGDTGVLKESMAFLEGPPVPPQQESIYDLFASSAESGTLYEHCKRAILYGIDTRGYGSHGLPLMGCGDWNDGMNLVGEEGQGESVWLAWFFIMVLLDFAKVAEIQQDASFAERCRNEAETLRQNAERNAWDGDWYRRAYFDNGEPLGSRTNPECQIDSLPQSWAVLCGQAEPERASTAMQHVDERLVRRADRLIQLFDPPFDNSHLEPGYIKGYVPGVRENGGQYTHAAVWTVMAFAEMGDVARAWELFRLINPVNHGSTANGMNTYKVEPYVVAADVYGVDPHIGRGGWTWYTGSAGWMYRLIIESLLGLSLEIDQLHLAPQIPDDWDGFAFTYRFRDTHHRVRVRKVGPGRKVRRVRMNGQPTPDLFIRLNADKQSHEVEVDIGE